MNKSKISGYSLIEMLVVISIFAVLAVISTQSLFLTIRSSKKAEAMVRVQDNLNYALSVIERQIQNATEIVTSSCSGAGVDYYDQDGGLKKFYLYTDGGKGYIYQNSEKLTSSQVNITSASFTCNDALGRVPASLDVSLTGEDLLSGGVESAELTLTSKIYLRQYN